MKTYTIQIPWLHALESVFFDPEETLEPGDIIHTSECWYEELEPHEYEVEIVSLAKNASTYTMKLRYQEQRNPEIAIVNDAWGVSTVEFDTKELTATAEWANEPPSKEYDGNVKAKISSQNMTEDLGYITVQRRKRRQVRFRSELLRLDPTCALSGENAVVTLEAAHIVETSQLGGYTASNGILLRADLHRLFDTGILKIANDGSVSLTDGIPKESSYHSEMASLKLKRSVLRRISKALKQRG